MDIVEFLSERIRDDEAAARRLLTDPSVSESGKWYEWRLLRECEAKRRLLGIIESARQGALAAMVTSAPGDTAWTPDVIEWTTLSLNALAFPYSDHPDFEPAWQLSP